MNQKLAPHGFSLIELLVVISLLGMLMVTGLASYQNSRRAGRDSRRLTDIKSIQNAMEQYNGQNSLYPPGGTDCEANAGVTSYFPGGTLPVDPKNSGSNVYTISCSAAQDSYCICASMEQTGMGNATANAGSGGTCTFGSGASATWYCLRNSQ